MAGTYVLYSFMLLMLIMGTLNMLLLKYQHMQMVPMGPGEPPAHFDHPWLQAGLMMVGEFFCLLAWLCTRSQADTEQARNVPKWVFLVPCCCDLTATALLCMGIALIAVSVAQMCRGTIIIFVCAMSVVFLGRRQRTFQLVGVGLVTFGITMVSISALMKPGTGSFASGNAKLITGISLCIVAQVFQATMFVYEEKIMSKYVVQPLQVVGMEGLFGIGVSAVILAILYPLGYANTPGAVYQVRHSLPLFLSVIGSMFAVALFNFAGATVTQQSSAVARTTIKISSTILIWIAELVFGWNTFSFLQLFGFVFVASGTLIYNRLVVVPFFEDPVEAKALLKNAKAETSGDNKA